MLIFRESTKEYGRAARTKGLGEIRNYEAADGATWAYPVDARRWVPGQGREDVGTLERESVAPSTILLSASRLLPIVAIETSILHGFGEMFGADVVALIEVGDRAGDFQNAVVSPSR